MTLKQVHKLYDAASGKAPPLNKRGGICVRCGNKVPPNAGVTGRWADKPVVEHTYCNRVFRGSRVHYKTSPSSLAPTETFIFTSDEGVTDIYNVSGILAFLDKRKPETITISVDRHLVEHMVNRNGVQWDSVDEVVGLRHAEGGGPDDPVVLLYIPQSGEHILLDGAHRAVFAYRAGNPTLEAYVVHPRDCLGMVLRDVQPDQLAGFTA